MFSTQFTVSDRTLESIKKAADVLPWKDLHENGQVLSFDYWFAIQKMMIFHSIDETMDMKKAHATARHAILKEADNEKDYMTAFHTQRGEYSDAINKVYE
jgi:hypothetical protein